MPRTAQDGPRPIAINLFSPDHFDGFGVSRFHPQGEPVECSIIRGKTSTHLHRGVRDQAPQRPGVYGMLDPKGRLIYVGKAKKLRTRLMCYFRPESRDPKAGRILKHTRTLIWEHAETEFAALLRELELIQRYRPRFNVIGQPGRQRHFYVCLGRSPAPQAYVSRTIAKTDLASYGPFVGRKAADLAVRRINDTFQLRDCPSREVMTFSDQRTLFDEPLGAKCLRYEIGTCLGPCAAMCNRNAYSAAIRRARAFLDGKDRSLLERLKQEMLEASQAMAFEKACALRDRLHDLEWIDQRLTLLRKARNQQCFVYPSQGHDERPVWYIISHGRVQCATRAPQTPKDQARLRQLLQSSMAGMLTADPPGAYPVDSVLLVASWFRRYSSERQALVPATAILQQLEQDISPCPTSVPISP